MRSAEHGVYATYVAGCRCPECTEANAEYHRVRRGCSPRGPRLTEHDRAGYQRGCRCGVCVEANRAYAREWIYWRRRAS